MDQRLYQKYYEVQSGDFLLYYDYTAYQELAAQKFVNDFAVNSVDLTEDEIEQSSCSTTKSPTQARNFKLPCDGCNRSFTSKKRLENHTMKCLTKNANRKAFSCKICARSFKKRVGLFKHTKKNHDGTNDLVEDKEIISEDEIEFKTTSIFHHINLLAQSDS